MSTILRLRLRLRPLLRAIQPPFALRHAPSSSSSSSSSPSSSSSSSSHPPKTLAKPTKFNPPSHPSARPLPRDPLNYPGPPQPPRDPTRRYPNTMPPPNTWAHFFLTSRVLHFYISMGTLISLAAVVSVRNFLNTSPFAKTVFWDWTRPADSVRSVLAAVKAHVEAESRRVAEMRKRKVDDVDLRGEYRRAHGMESEGGFGGWAAKKSGGEPVVAVAKEGWVEERIKEVEEEAARLAEVAGTDGVVVVEKVQESPEKKKKSSWW